MSAGIIFSMRFISGGAKAFKSYVDYIDRDEAVRIEADSEFNVYNSYMENPEKSTGLFTVDNDSLTDAQKKELKDVFENAQKNGSNMWQGVFSFETEWLKEYGIIDKGENLNESKMKEYTRAALDELFKKEAMQGCQYSAAIHYNTDHIHIHVAAVDPSPAWAEGEGRCYRNKTGELKQRGMFKQHNVDAAKGRFTNLVIDAVKTHEFINDFVRGKVVARAKGRNISEDKELKHAFAELLDTLPDNMQLWFYGKNAMQGYRPQIDAITDKFIEKYFKKEFAAFTKEVDRLSDEYKRAYGGNKEADEFKQNTMKDFYYRMGNTILTECRACEKDRRAYAQKKGNRQLYNKYASKRIRGSISALRRLFDKEMRNMQNQLAYEQLQREIEHDYS